MASPPSVPLRTVFAAIWSGMAEVFIRLRGPSLIGLAIYLVFEIVDAALMARTDSPLLQNVPSLIRNLLLLPFDIAIFRLLIPGELASQYSFAISAPRFQRLAGWTIGLWLWISVVLPLVMVLLTPAHGIQLVATIAIIILTVAFMIRMAVLFPAIAVDSNAATVSNALADTSGRSWFILKAFLVTFVPVLAAMVLVTGIAAFGDVSLISGRSLWTVIPRTVLFGLGGFLIHAAIAVTAARLYGWIGSQVKDGAPSAPVPC